MNDRDVRRLLAFVSRLAMLKPPHASPEARPEAPLARPQPISIADCIRDLLSPHSNVFGLYIREHSRNARLSRVPPRHKRSQSVGPYILRCGISVRATETFGFKAKSGPGAALYQLELKVYSGT
ncbi:MAG TPA: hypothetical protein VIG99_33095, partial [Myxococcaceae bacterium]